VNSKQRQTYYDLLGVYPGASAIEIRRAYRELSKKYHPDTTTLTTAVATVKFQSLNEAYATVSHPERRLAYDLEIGYSRVFVAQSPPSFQTLPSRPDKYRSSAYLDPTERPLSGGEIFALGMLVITLLGCLVLAISIGALRGELW
jgi:curved DNA-binding protein CbpA